jgi:hypothetical protein
MNEAQAPVDIYQFHLSIRGISPAIWRRVLMRSDSTLADVHYIIQILMGWSNFYLHQFTIHGKHYAVQRLFYGNAHDAVSVRLCDLGLRVGGRFLYEYSFFEWWQHEIRLEKKLVLDERKTYPVYIAGKRAAPPEDCGGPRDLCGGRSTFLSSIWPPAFAGMTSPSVGCSTHQT